MPFTHAVGAIRIQARVSPVSGRHPCHKVAHQTRRRRRHAGDRREVVKQIAIAAGGALGQRVGLALVEHDGLRQVHIAEFTHEVAVRTVHGDAGDELLRNPIKQPDDVRRVQAVRNASGLSVTFRGEFVAGQIDRRVIPQA